MTFRQVIYLTMLGIYQSVFMHVPEYLQFWNENLGKHIEKLKTHKRLSIEISASLWTKINIFVCVVILFNTSKSSYLLYRITAVFWLLLYN